MQASCSLQSELQGLRSLADLTEHLTTRADDSHAAPVQAPRGVVPVSLHYHLYVKPW